MDKKLLLFFEKKPAALPLYHVFEQKVLRQTENVCIRIQTTQITFSNRHVFACVSFLPIQKAKKRPDPYIVISFGLPRRETSPRIDGATEPYPGRWTHHILIARPEDIDTQVMAWIKEAAAFAAAKR